MDGADRCVYAHFGHKEVQHDETDQGEAGVKEAGLDFPGVEHQGVAVGEDERECLRNGLTDSGQTRLGESLAVSLTRQW